MSQTEHFQMTKTPCGLPCGDRWIIFSGLASLSLGQAIILSSFGPIARDFGMTEYNIGFIISISAIIAAVVAPWWGRKSDGLGHRRIFLVAMVGNLVTTLGFSFLLKAGQMGLLMGSGIFLSLLFTRMTYAFVASAGMPAASGVIASETPKENRARAMSVIGSAFSFGSLLGAALTFAAAGQFGTFGPLWVACAIITIVVVVSVFLWAGKHSRSTALVPEEVKEEKQGWRQFWKLLLIGTSAYTAMGMVQQLMPFFVQDAFSLETSAAVEKAGLLTTAGAISTLVVLQITSRISIGASLLLVMGGAMAVCAVSLYLFPAKIEVLVFAHILMGAGFGLLLPGLQALVSLRASDGQQAVASGYLASATTTGYVIGPSLGGIIYALSPTSAFSCALGLLVLTLLLSVSNLKKG